MPRRRAKIVCTLGPAVDSPGAVRELTEAGMDVARLNFSHGTNDEHARRAEWIRAASAETGRPVAILQDLPGPKLRTGRRGPARAETGCSVALVAGGEGSDDAIAVDYERLTRDLEPGDRILLGDGVVELRVESASGERLLCRVEHGGALRARMGVNLPSQRVALDAITARDREALAFGLALGVDYVALSFVRSAGDLRELRELCDESDDPPHLVAKIETPGAVADLAAVVEAADALMLARGDLGVELPPEAVPVVQKRTIGLCREKLRPVIVATEMLHSMVRAPRPTRAEASDVANAVFDGADALMLSAETATGDHPARACAMMARIIAAAEAADDPASPGEAPGLPTPEAVARSACGLAESVGARSLLAFTQSGRTARLVSKSRPAVPVIGLSPSASTLRRMALLWGVEPRSFDVSFEVDRLASDACAHLCEQPGFEAGDRVVMVFGTPIGEASPTNSIRVETLG